MAKKISIKEKKGNDILRFFGILKDVDWEAREKNMKKFRENFEVRLKNKK